MFSNLSPECRRRLRVIFQIAFFDCFCLARWPRIAFGGDVSLFMSAFLEV